MTKQEIEEKLLSPLKGKRKILILTHDNPDPDSIAAAFGLRYILKKTLGVTPVIAYGGIIGRVENQSMVKILHIDMVPLSEVSLRSFPVIALVDCQPHTGNVNLPAGINPNIVIDHHPMRKSAEKAEFVDIRRGVGSASTIITQYIRHLGLPLDREVATALYYGIKSDTRDLGRQSTDVDVRATIFLFPFALQKKLAKIEHPEKSREYYIKLYSVLGNARIYGDVVLARVDLMTFPEMISQFADELIQIEGIRWCMCYGRHNGSLIFSIRTTRPSYMAGVLAHKICHGIGKGGGHETYAAGKIDLAQALKKVKDPEDILLKRFLKETCPRGAEPTMLIPGKDKSEPRSLPAEVNP
ncbi:MAG TPA: bifunctional oligoribonuclease/PAP phosphatase NrnA [Deltaproteobacteria bacterium]|nr:bifunctional oligoribonuclease/PAP phosphatase NrnA [Deltaproteobacteria bacterium]HOI08503.1 bifunctional oligoribonuclease/PAP phosphatase NrnA [Deltaproteobacteria bacterium]